MILGRRLLLLLQRQILWLQTLLLLFFSFVIFTSQVGAVNRFTDRSLMIDNSEPGITTNYTVSFTYTLPDPVGSVDMLFCLDPIPTNPTDPTIHACVPPTGLDVSGAILTGQTGETGYAITTRTANHLVLSRTASAPGGIRSKYVFSNIVNPTATTSSYAIRLSDYTSTDASGPILNLGSVVTQVAEGITLATQVPPMLLFCVGKQVSPNCDSTTGGNYTDLGDISATNTLFTSSQMAAGTNASAGYSIAAYGTTMEAGSNVINALTTPTLSAPGNSQFGINLTENSSPSIGSVPDGQSTNAVVAPGYGTSNLYKFQSGDLIASAPNVSLLRRFTISYIVNAPPDLRAGVYTTTLTYICSGHF